MTEQNERIESILGEPDDTRGNALFIGIAIGVGIGFGLGLAAGTQAHDHETIGPGIARAMEQYRNR